MQDVDIGLEVLQSVLPDSYLMKNSVFSVPRLISNYSVSTEYTNRITSTINDGIDENDKRHYQPPAGAWSQGPPPHMKAQNQKSTNKGNKNRSNANKNNNTNLNSK
eukprot:10594415-Ditylum_brightwellii.AAC.1